MVGALRAASFTKTAAKKLTVDSRTVGYSAPLESREQFLIVVIDDTMTYFAHATFAFDDCVTGDCLVVAAKGTRTHISALSSDVGKAMIVTVTINGGRFGMASHKQIIQGACCEIFCNWKERSTGLV